MGHVEEADQSMPTFVVKPHLEDRKVASLGSTPQDTLHEQQLFKEKNELQEKEWEQEEGFGSWETFHA